MKRRVVIASVIIVAALAYLGFAVLGSGSHKETAHAPTTQASVSKPADPPKTPVFDKLQYSTSDPASPWVVVNKTRPLKPVNYAPNDLVSVGSQLLRTEAAVALEAMFTDAEKAGYTIKPLSGYRSFERQSAVYDAEVRDYGQTVADTESARPGYSEHQTGWAIDVGGGGCGIENCFGNTPEGKWVAANAYRYGFMVRYTAAKEAITGYRPEPWHIRYVGKELSEELRRSNVLTLEEFFGLPAAPDYTATY